MSDEIIYLVFADDDPDDQFLVQGLLREISTSIRVYPVYNGRQLLDFLEKQHTTNSPLPHVIITDLNMPVLNGFETIKVIKQTKEFAEIPLYVLSTCSEERTRLISLDLGAKNYYTKPDSSFEMKNILKEMLSL